METMLTLKHIVEGTEKKFPSNGNVVEIHDFSFSAERMGVAPTITAVVKNTLCLDSLWDDTVFCEFNGERYYLKNIPSSSYSNEDILYEHSCTFVSEREVLEHTYFLDMVTQEEMSDVAEYVSQGTNIQFFGKLDEFVARINKSLENSGISGYTAVIDSGETYEDALFTCNDSMIKDALDIAYEVWKVPYYFIGKVIHFGQGILLNTTFRYGVDKELLSISRNNISEESYDRCTGVGSSDNISYYYPNPTPKGTLALDIDSAGSLPEGAIEIDDMLQLSKYNLESGEGFYDGDNFVIKSLNTQAINPFFRVVTRTDSLGLVVANAGTSSHGYVNLNVFTNRDYVIITARVNNRHFSTNGRLKWKVRLSSSPVSYGSEREISPFKVVGAWAGYTNGVEIGCVNGVYCGLFKNVVFYYKVQDFYALDNGEYLPMGMPLIDGNTMGISYSSLNHNYYVTFPSIAPNLCIQINGEGKYHVAQTEGDYHVFRELGIKVASNAVSDLSINDSIAFYQSLWIKPQGVLMPALYRASQGERRFYNAIDYPRSNQNIDTLSGEVISGGLIVNPNYEKTHAPSVTYYSFGKPYNSVRRHEHIESFGDIKPSIKGIRNSSNEPIDKFKDIAFDIADNDTAIENAEGSELQWVHPFFYVKLAKTDGAYGFNLFDHALESGNMTISMTSGHCAPCEFEIAVSDSDNKSNLVQVWDYDVYDGDGNIVWYKGELVRYANGDYYKDSQHSIGIDRIIAPTGNHIEGNVVIGTAQPQQNNTMDNEVWLALRKDINTYGVIFPNHEHNIVPDTTDSFVLLNINMPYGYILNAENELTKAIIKYMYEHNNDKFGFTLNFSKVYLANNPFIAESINEGIYANIQYNGNTLTRFASSVQIQMSSDSPLPSVTMVMENDFKVKRHFWGEIQSAIDSSLPVSTNNGGIPSLTPGMIVPNSVLSVNSHGQMESVPFTAIQNASLKCVGGVIQWEQENIFDKGADGMIIDTGRERIMPKVLCAVSARGFVEPLSSGGTPDIDGKIASEEKFPIGTQIYLYGGETDISSHTTQEYVGDKMIPCVRLFDLRYTGNIPDGLTDYNRQDNVYLSVMIDTDTNSWAIESDSREMFYTEEQMLGRGGYGLFIGRTFADSSYLASLSDKHPIYDFSRGEKIYFIG